MSVETARVEGRKTLAYKSQQGVEKEEEKKRFLQRGTHDRRWEMSSELTSPPRPFKGKLYKDNSTQKSFDILSQSPRIEEKFIGFELV